MIRIVWAKMVRRRSKKIAGNMIEYSISQLVSDVHTRIMVKERADFKDVLSKYIQMNQLKHTGILGHQKIQCSLKTLYVQRRVQVNDVSAQVATFTLVLQMAQMLALLLVPWELSVALFLNLEILLLTSKNTATVSTMITRNPYQIIHQCQLKNTGLLGHQIIQCSLQALNVQRRVDDVNAQVATFTMVLQMVEMLALLLVQSVQVVSVALILNLEILLKERKNTAIVLIMMNHHYDRFIIVTMRDSVKRQNEPCII